MLEAKISSAFAAFRWMNLKIGGFFVKLTVKKDENLF
jgi:hypothetical protein